MLLSVIFEVLLLTNFKHDDEDSPVPEEVRDTLAEFHNDLLLHCGEKFFLFSSVFTVFRHLSIYS